MNRKHTVEEYVLTYEKLKKIKPSIEFSSDFIISYPGESEQDFNQTLQLVNKIKFINSYSFIFSPRPGTKAANLELIDEKISKERLKIIQKHLFENQKNINKSFENKSVDVLVENKIKGQTKLFGRNKYMNSVIFEGEENSIGKIVKVKILDSNQNTLFGKIENTRDIRAA
jgi:tRNA-2-methylthio-N6-dimethylallyladenosine synthase